MDLSNDIFNNKNKLVNYLKFVKYNGDWGLGIGDWAKTTKNFKKIYL